MRKVTELIGCPSLGGVKKEKEPCINSYSSISVSAFPRAPK